MTEQNNVNNPEETPESDAAEATPEHAETAQENVDADVVEEAAEEPATDKEAELIEDLRRLQAEYINYRNRVERDRDVSKNNAISSVFSSLIPVFDDISAAREHGDLEEGPFAAIVRKLESTLASLGLETIEEAGVVFDPTMHEAMLQAPNAEIPADHVGQVLRKGYRNGDRLLRAAQVIVSTGPAE